MLTLLRKLVIRYLLLSSFLAHIVVLLTIIVLSSQFITEHWRWKAYKKLFVGPIDSTEVKFIPAVESGIINPSFKKLPSKVWIKIHQQKDQDGLVFQRQEHAGSAFDSKRLKLYIFGSNTHGADWNNAIQTFDMGTLEWQRLYEPDPFETYSINKQGIPIAGSKKNHPWAMHTFDSIAYDSLNDQLIVASYPKHLKPGRFGKWISQQQWQKIKIQPTWIYDFITAKWQAVTSHTIDFFPYTISYDSDKNEIVGFKPYGIYKFLNQTKGWKKITKKGVVAYHTNSVYDSKNKVFILFGGNNKDNTVYSFSTDSKKLVKMPTSGIRPSGDEHLPFAFHQGLSKAVALVDVDEDGHNYAQTWLYELSSDRWQRVISANFPFKLGMNYNMEYDPLNELLVLVANAPGEPTAVWVLHL